MARLKEGDVGKCQKCGDLRPLQVLVERAGFKSLVCPGCARGKAR